MRHKKLLAILLGALLLGGGCDSESTVTPAPDGAMAADRDRLDRGVTEQRIPSELGSAELGPAELGIGGAGDASGAVGDAGLGSSTGDGGSAPGDGGQVSDVATPGGTPTPGPKGCSQNLLKPGTHSATLAYGKLKRIYDVHVPTGYKAGQAMPLVFYLHPLGVTKWYLQGAGNNRKKADKEGFIAVFPEGYGGSWNAGACCGPANGASNLPKVDDVGFIRALLTKLSSQLCVDKKRVYAAGFSNGGFLAHRLACEASDIIAAIAPVSAVNGMSACKPSRAVPVLMINGTADAVVPYKGGFGFPGVTNGTFISAPQTFDDWAKRDGCSGQPVDTLKVGKATCSTHKTCQGSAEVTQCTLKDAGHCWFGEMYCFLGTNSADVKATDLTWEFFSRFSL